MNVDLLSRFFDLSKEQQEQFELFSEIFVEKNAQVNLVSRKDSENLVERHFLHSISLSKFYNLSDAKVLDVGTGGGFPGLPLAILFPSARFHLVDARAKKIAAVNDFAKRLGLKNVTASHIRIEDFHEKFQFVVSRAVTGLERFTNWVEKNIEKGAHLGQHHGIIYLRGLDFDFNTINDEINQGFDCNRIIHLEEHFNLDFFSSKKVIFLQRL